MALRKTYKSGRFTIISRMDLTETQVEKIIDIVNQFKYEGLNTVAVAIRDELKSEISSIIDTSIRYTSSSSEFKIKLYTRKVKLFKKAILFVWWSERCSLKLHLLLFYLRSIFNIYKVWYNAKHRKQNNYIVINKL